MRYPCNTQEIDEHICFLGCQRIQQALTELVQIEVAFMTFMYRILQARSIFEQQYLAQTIDVESLSKFDELLNKGMIRTVELIQKNTGIQKGKKNMKVMNLLVG